MSDDPRNDPHDAPGLNAAYALRTPEDSRRLYRDWADSYDSDFIDEMDYRLPRHVAQVFLAARPEGPVLDLGAGTGVMGFLLDRQVGPVDGTDISPEMLAVARRRGVYRALYAVDLTGDLSALPRGYGAVVSAGTFTHGHLGPEVLTALPDLARTGALFVIAVNAAHYVALGFEAGLQALRDAGRIGPVAALDVPIYDKAGHEHAGDRALVLTWRTI